ARGQVEAGELAGLDAERGVEVLARGAGSDAQNVGLVGDAEVADLARDHLQPGLGAQEPAADLLDPAQRARVVADVDAHLDALVHERDRTLAIALVELLEEVFHRVDGAHRRGVYGETSAEGRDAPAMARDHQRAVPLEEHLRWAGPAVVSGAE